MNWKEIDEARYTEMLEILPPALWLTKGFLVGEPYTHRECKETKQFRAAFTPFLSLGGKFFEGDEPMTSPEFRAFEPIGVLR